MNGLLGVSACDAVSSGGVTRTLVAIGHGAVPDGTWLNVIRNVPAAPGASETSATLTPPGRFESRTGSVRALPPASRRPIPAYPCSVHVVDDVLTSRNVTPIVPAAPCTESIRASSCEAWHRDDAALVDVVEDDEDDDDEDGDDDEDDDDAVADPPDEWQAPKPMSVATAASHGRRPTSTT
jgi:hypothetical protein